MSNARLVEYYLELPEFQASDDPDLWTSRIQESMRSFRNQVRAAYTEGTLLRMLNSIEPVTRRAAVLGLGFLGSYASNAQIARMLHDEDELVARMAGDTLWEVWFRGGSESQNQELQHVIRLPDQLQVFAGLEDLLRETEEFPEVFNQRAIVYFQQGEFSKSIRDCKRVLELNPHHFGAQAGMGQCYMKLRKVKSAIRAFRLALQINPTMTHLEETIRALEETLGEDESREDR